VGVEEPLVSVIIPAFNAAAFIEEAIRSVLGQSYTRQEIIVVDDGSSDGTAETVRGLGISIKLIRTYHLGVGQARNTAIAAADGEVFAFLDADDIWLPEKLVRQMTRLAERPELDMVFAGVRQFADPRSRAKVDPRFEVLAGRAASTLVIRRASYDRTGGFDVALQASEFFDWVLVAEEAGLVSETLPEVLVLRRLHEGNNGVRRRELQSQEYLALIRRRLEKGRNREE
jgi:glycosyltransferase involved in cell wall biosynthesis